MRPCLATRNRRGSTRARARLRRNVAAPAEAGGDGRLALGIFHCRDNEDNVRAIGKMRHERLGQRKRAEVIRRERHILRGAHLFRSRPAVANNHSKRG